MSFSVWPMTLKQNRQDTLPDTPVGRLALSGRCVARIRTMPNAGPVLMMNSRVVARGLAELRVREQVLASSITHTTGHSFSDRREAISRVTRLSGHSSRGSARSRSARRPISARSSRSDSAARPIDSSSMPDTNRWLTRSSGSRSPHALELVRPTARTAGRARPRRPAPARRAVLPCRGIAPTSQLW